MTYLKNKVAVVFAASGAIAGAVAKSFATKGSRVYVSARDLKAVQLLADEIKKTGGWAEAKQVDAMNENEIDNYLNQIVADNEKAEDWLYSNAANFYGKKGLIELITLFNNLQNN